jgi:hypothetical protein
MPTTASLSPAKSNLIVILIEKPLKSGHLCTTATFGALRVAVVDISTAYVIIIIYWISNVCTIKPVYNGQPWDSKVQKRPLFRGWSLKIITNIEKLGILLPIVDSWPLFRGGC